MTHATASQTASAPEVVRLSGPAGLVAAIPSCLGFTPSNSIVVVCMTTPRHRIGPVARVDLFPTGTAEPVQQLMSFARRYADEAAVICYHDGDRPACMDDVLTALNNGGIPLFAALSVQRDRIRSARTDQELRSDTGVATMAPADPQAQTLAAATAMAGRQTLTSRQELVDSIAAPTGSAAVTARRAIEKALEAMPPAPADRAELPGPELVKLVESALTTARQQHTEHGGVTRATAAGLIALSTQVGCRDLMLYYAVSGETADVVSMLISIAGQCPDEYAAEFCAVLAAAAYRFGDGALAQCALDRAFARDPDHRLATLLTAAIAGGIPPEDMAQLGNPQSG